MKLCKCCRTLMIGDDANHWLQNLKKLMKLHGFVTKTIPDVALSLGPMCNKCQQIWFKELTAP